MERAGGIWVKVWSDFTCCLTEWLSHRLGVNHTMGEIESEDHLGDCIIIHMRDKVAWTRGVAVGWWEKLIPGHILWVDFTRLADKVGIGCKRRSQGWHQGVWDLSKLGGWGCPEEKYGLQERVIWGGGQRQKEELCCGSCWIWDAILSNTEKF